MKPFSLSGVDGSGKSQQIRLLVAGQEDHPFHFTRPLVEYSPRWPRLVGVEMSRWWFESVSTDELMDIMIESLNVRHQDCQDGRITILDRGYRMFQAVCAATWATRENVSVEDVIDDVERRFRAKLDHDPAELELLLIPEDRYFQSVSGLKRLLAPTKNPFPEYMERRYALYQSHLRRAVEHSFAAASVRKVVVASSILDVQSELRKMLNQEYGLRMPDLGGSVEMLVGFGGLSESGKSSFAEFLRAGSDFCRLKLRYFVDVIEKRGETATPEKLTCELLCFFQRHYYLRRYTVESLHAPDLPAFLKLMFGDRFRTVYLEADRSVRIQRASVELAVDETSAEKIVRQKDEAKVARGADKVREIADIVFDNSSNTPQENREELSRRVGTLM